MNTILFVLGTRPEAIKLAPVIRACKSSGFLPYVVHTGQHHSHRLGQEFLTQLGLPEPDVHLGIGSVSSSAQTAAILQQLEPILGEAKPAAIVVQGDTTSTLAGALAGQQNGILVAHVEAGLRSWDRRMPEEHNRVMVDQIADLLFAPTPVQKLNLEREGHGGRCEVVGNTIVDALQTAMQAAGDGKSVREQHGVADAPFAFMTLHRAENVDDREILQSILDGVGKASAERSLPVLLPLHPRTQKRIEEFGLTIPDGIRTSDPIDYVDCLLLQKHAALVISDSGGLQEEAAILGTPCVTLRRGTERPETVHVGANYIAGTESRDIVAAASQALMGSQEWHQPYGDGETSARILQSIQSHLAQPPAAGPTPPDPGDLPQDGNHTGRALGEQEFVYLGHAVRSGTLNSTKGTLVHEFQDKFAARIGAKHGIACASGSAAVHCAVAALGVKAGDEIITTPITDMGALACIPYEGAVPVFCDVDPDTLNVTAETIAAQITDRTVAVIVTHLFGLSCDMGPILELCRSKGIKVIEDAAQAFLAEDSAGRVGTMGDIACFSLQQGKHMTTGEGGIVVTNDDHLARQVFLFVNKAWGYGDAKPDHYFPALNYRMTELQGAVALAQMGKLDWVVGARQCAAAGLEAGLSDVSGLGLPTAGAGQRHVYWKYSLRVDANVIEGGAVGLGQGLRQKGIFCAPRYVQKPAFECQLFQDWNAHPVTALPLSANPRKDGPMPPFDRKDYPGAIAGLEQVLVLPINEFYTNEHVQHVVDVIRAEAAARTT